MPVHVDPASAAHGHGDTGEPHKHSHAVKLFTLMSFAFCTTYALEDEGMTSMIA
jgi:hypothetical protein